jgi:hypothetical protein
VLQKRLQIYKHGKHVGKVATMARTAFRALAEDCRQEVRDTLIALPNDPAPLIAEHLAIDLDAEVYRELAHYLIIAFFLRLIRAERSRERRESNPQLALPGFELLPSTIRIKRRVIALGAATTGQIRQYVRQVARRHYERQKADPLLNQARALLALMEKHAAKNERITVDEVLRNAIESSPM